MVSISDPGGNRSPYDYRLIDRLTERPEEAFDGEVFRVTRLNADPLAYSTSGGRWAPPSTSDTVVQILYTSFEQDGAIAEVASYLAEQTPPPSKSIVVHRIAVTTRKTLRLARADLIALGIDMDRYGERPYRVPPTRTQEIGATLNFLGFNGLIAPSARWPCDNLMVFGDNDSLNDRLEVVESAQVDWQAWAAQHGFL